MELMNKPLQKIIFLLTFLVFSVQLFAQKTFVPDDNFEQELIYLGYDDELDDSVITSNINTVTFLNVFNRSIHDLTGIKDFTALQELSCSFDSISYLDVSGLTNLYNLACNNSYTKTINLDGLVNLTYLDCSYNLLSKLDLSKLQSLNEFHGSENPNLSCIQIHWLQENFSYNWEKDVSTSFSTSCNSITEIDKSSNQKLKIDIYPNPTNGIVTIENGNGKVEILNVFGESILSKTINLENNTINISHLVSGVYFLKINDAILKIVEE